MFQIGFIHGSLKVQYQVKPFQMVPYQNEHSFPGVEPPIGYVTVILLPNS